MIRNLFATKKMLADYAGQYAVDRNLGVEAARQFRMSVRLLAKWHGKPVALRDLSEKMLSDFLRDYAERVSPATVRNRRVALLALWRQAADDGLIRPPTRKIFKVTRRQQPVMAWRPAEVLQLIAAAQKLPRTHKCGLRRSEWFELAIRIAWDSALRWGDQIQLDARIIQPDGSFSILQSKTQRIVTCHLSPSTMAMLADSLQRVPRRLATPWHGSHETFNAQMRRLVAKAGIRPGSWKWLRRGSATDVELRHPGSGAAHLGHVPGSRIAEQSYFDQTILQREQNRPIELIGGG